MLGLDASLDFLVGVQFEDMPAGAGAGALAAAGLRSITAKHLAMATQCVGAVMGASPHAHRHPDRPLPHARRAILLPDFERLLQVRSSETAFGLGKLQEVWVCRWS